MDLLKRVYVVFFVLVASVVLGAGACGFDPQIGDGAFACAADRSCPDGFICAGDNKCYRPGNGPPVVTVDGGDPDGPPPFIPSKLQADPISLPEGNGGTTDFVFTVRLDPASTREVKVDYATNDGTAKAPEDYTSVAGTLTFPPGSTSQTVVVKVIADRFEEPDETFTLKLTNLVNAELLTGVSPDVVATIKNDDAPGLAIDDVTVTEGDVDTTATFTVSLSGTYASPVTANYATFEGTALEGSDFIATSDALTFAPGERQKTFTVPIKGDLAHEPEESFFVTLSNVVGAPVVDAEALAKIIDNDPIPSLSIADAMIAEGDTGNANMAFTVTLSAASGEEVKVSFATTAGTAGPADYSTTSGTLVFPPGTTAQTISVPINGDVTDEPDETFTVTLSAAVNATVAKPTAIGTIKNDDLPPVLTVQDVALAEGNSGTTTLPFVFTLSAASAKTITVTYATANIEATAGSDYTAVSNTLLTFLPGELTKTVNVLVTGDTVVEPTETFALNLTAPVNVTLARTFAVGTIVNDDGAAATFSIDDPLAIAEGDSSTTTLTFTVTCTATSGTVSNASVSYATADLSATAGSDYVEKSGTLSFASCTTGGTSQTFTVDVNGDTTFEPNETFAVNLSNPSHANLDLAIVKSQGIGTITNDDSKPTIGIAPVAANEGNAGTKIFSFDVSLTNASSTAITVDYATSAGTATAGTDYVTTSGTLSFAPGETTKSVNVTVNGDLVFELDETFVVNLSNNSTANSILPANTNAVGTIQNDDTQPTLSIDDVSLAEGNSGTTNFVFTVTLSGPSSQTITVDYATSDGTAVAPGDYTAKTNTLTFTPGGSLTQTITIVVNGDTVFEPNETFNVTLTNPTNATTSDDVGVGTILNDDQARTISINNAQANEGSSMTFTVTMSTAAQQKVTVTWTLIDVTTSPADRQSTTTGTIEFNPGQVEKTLSISTTQDSIDEIDETFNIVLSNVVGAATLFDDTGVGTILDNDPPPTITITQLRELDEGDSGTTAFNFTVTLSAVSGKIISVQYATQDVSTTSGGSPSGRDYQSTSGTLTWNPGDPLTKTITVLVNGDTAVEANEEFQVVLSNAVNASLPSSPSGTGRILNDD